MKLTNYKLYFLVEIICIVLVVLLMIVLFLLIFDCKYPVFKYSLLYSNIATSFFLFVLSLILIIVIKYWRNRVSNALSIKLKIIFSVSCLALSFFILLSIEYLIYINNQDKFNIESSYIKDSTKDEINNIKKRISYCEGYLNTYNSIYEELKNKKSIGYSNSGDDFYYTIINGDTIEIKVYKIQTVGAGSNGIYFDNGLYDADEIGIFLNNEGGHISHPTSQEVLKDMQINDSINVSDFRLLVHAKIEMYQNVIKEYNTILENELVISFEDFVIYNIFNPNITGNKTHILIRLIFLLQAFVVTFFSGYIYQTLYKMLDKEEK